jgi:hypothetical protein
MGTVFEKLLLIVYTLLIPSHSNSDSSILLCSCADGEAISSMSVDHCEGSQSG